MNRCPICGKLGSAASEARPDGVFPFCSERCKLRDLGRWLSDAYQIPVEPTDEGDEATPDEWVNPNGPDRGQRG